MQTDQDQEFLKHLREVITKAQEARAKYAFRKLTFVVSLLGVGSIQTKTNRVDFTVILYIIPAIAIAFDLYILDKDYSIKRIGAFLRENSLSKLEKQWENYVNRTPASFVPFTTPLLTIAVIIICTIIIATREPNIFVLSLWLIISTGSLMWLYWKNNKFRKDFGEEAESKLEEKPDG